MSFKTVNDASLCVHNLARWETSRGASVLNRWGKLHVSRSHVSNNAPLAFVARRTLCRVITDAMRRYRQKVLRGIYLLLFCRTVTFETCSHCPCTESSLRNFPEFLHH